MRTLTSSLVNLTLEVWQQRTSDQLMIEDGREIIRNTHGFFSILAEWDIRSQTGSGSSLCGSCHAW